MASLQKNVAGQNVTFCLVSATTGAAVPTATFTSLAWVTVDGSQAGFAGSFTTLGNGQFQYAPTQAETNGTDVGILITVAGAVPVNLDFHTDPGVLLSQGTGTNQISLSSGLVTVGTNNDKTGYAITSNIKKNTSSSGFMFLMTDSTTHAPKTGLTVTSNVSIDGGAFTSTTNAVTELSNGVYTLNLAAADVNGNHIMLQFTASGADQLDVEIITQP